MKKYCKTIGYLAAIPLAFMASIAFGVAGWSGFGVITELNQQPTDYGAGAGQVFIKLAISNNPSGCSLPNGFYFSIENEHHKRLFATLLSAQMAYRSVSIWTTGNCHAWGYAELDGVRVQ